MNVPLRFSVRRSEHRNLGDLGAPTAVPLVPAVQGVPRITAKVVQELLSFGLGNAMGRRTQSSLHLAELKSMNEVVADGLSAILVPPGDPRALG